MSSREEVAKSMVGEEACWQRLRAAAVGRQLLAIEVAHVVGWWLPGPG